MPVTTAFSQSNGTILPNMHLALFANLTETDADPSGELQAIAEAPVDSVYAAVRQPVTMSGNRMSVHLETSATHKGYPLLASKWSSELPEDAMIIELSAGERLLTGGLEALRALTQPTASVAIGGYRIHSPERHTLDVQPYPAAPVSPWRKELFALQCSQRMLPLPLSCLAIPRCIYRQMLALRILFHSRGGYYLSYLSCQDLPVVRVDAPIVELSEVPAVSRDDCLLAMLLAWHSCRILWLRKTHNSLFFDSFLKRPFGTIVALTGAAFRIQRPWCLVLLAFTLTGFAWRKLSRKIRRMLKSVCQTS